MGRAHNQSLRRPSHDEEVAERACHGYGTYTLGDALSDESVLTSLDLVHMVQVGQDHYRGLYDD